VVTRDGILPDEEHIKAVKEYAEPHSTAEVHRFVGLSGYYREFIAGYAAICGPLMNIIKEDRRGRFELNPADL
jgi:hypothetical protein